MMHVWLAEQIGVMRSARGMKLNVLGPRGSAKSTLGTLALPLRAALECWEKYIWIISDTKFQACAHLENIKTELTGTNCWRRRFRRLRSGGRFGGAIRSCLTTR